MTYSAKQSSPKQINPKLLIQVIAVLLLVLLLTRQTLAAPETMLTTVDSDGIVGTATSLALNSSGYPVISYWDNHNLKLAVCNNAACTNPTLTTVDDGGDVGQHISLVLNSSDHPVIGYNGDIGFYNSNLKLAVCHDATCTNPTLTIVDSGDNNVGKYTSLALNSSGHAVISYVDDDNALKLAVCHDVACTNRTRTIVDNNGIYISLALNSSDYPIISYQNAGDLKLVVCKNATCTTTIQPPIFSTYTIVDSSGTFRDTSLVLNTSGYPIISYYDTFGNVLKLASCNNAACTNRIITPVDSTNNAGVSYDGYTALALNSSGHAVISYYDNIDSDNGRLKLATCNDAACTNPAITIVDSDGNVGRDTSVALNSSGYPVISYFDLTNTALKLAVCPICMMPARTTVDSSGNVGRYSSLALNSSGNPVIGHRDLTNTSLKLASCSNLNCSNHTLTTVDNTANVGNHASLALNGSGHALISYRDFTNESLKLAICHDATCTNIPTLRTVDNTANVGTHTSLVLNSSGHAVISYYDDTNGALKLAVCNDPTCTNLTLTTVDNTGDVGQHTSLAFNSSGHPIISYYDIDNGALKLAVCHDATCTNSPTLRTVDNTANVGAHSSLALNGSGYPVISYFDDTNDDLKLALCNVETCTAPTLTTVDSVGDVGRHISMALSSSNLALISYYDATNDDLKLAVCRDPACTKVTLTRVDGAGNAGQYTSLALDRSSFPVISYYDVVNEDLRLASYSTGNGGSSEVYLPVVLK